MGLGFNGTTCTFNSVSLPIISLDGSSQAAAVEVGKSADAAKSYVAGRADYTVTARLRGSFTSPVGTSATLTLDWNDQGSGDYPSLSTAIVTGVDISGSDDGAIESTVTFKKSA